MLSFYSGDRKVSIGVEDELPGTVCSYKEKGLRVTILPNTQIKEIIFGIAWMTMSDIEEQELYTWFAADPSLYKAYNNINN